MDIFWRLKQISLSFNYSIKNTMKKLLFITIISLFFSISSVAQQTKTNLSYKTSAKADSLLNEIKLAEHDTTKIIFYHTIGYEYEFINQDTALYYYKKALSLAQKDRSNNAKETADISFYQTLVIRSLRYIGIVHRNKGEYEKAMEYYKKALVNTLDSVSCQNKELCKREAGGIYNSMGIVLRTKGEYSEALKYYQKALKIFEDLDDKENVSLFYINIGVIHYFQDNFDEALNYYQKALEVKEELNDKRGIAFCCTNIGAILYLKKDTEKALEYYHKALEISKEQKDNLVISKCYANIGSIYRDSENFAKALKYYQKSLDIKELLGDKRGKSLILLNIATLYNDMGKFYNAKEYGEQSLEIAEKIKSLPQKKIAYLTLSNSHNGLKQYYKAFEYYKLYHKANDSLFNEKKNKQIVEMETKYQAEKKQQEIEKQQIMLEKKDLEAMKQEAVVSRQRIQRNAFIGGFALMLVLAFIVFISYKQKKKANILLAEQKYEIEEKNEELNQQNEEILTQRDEIEAQRDTVTKQKEHIEEIHKNLTDSINYAERIQQAVLPGNNFLLENFHDHFVLFMPHSVVSGDFYWVTRVNKWLIFTAADCTGHGVPGAFMSMLGISFLNEIVRKSEITQANEVLNGLRKNVIEALQQKGVIGEQIDGLDIAFCALNTETNILQFAGANNPLYIIRNGNNNGNIKMRRVSSLQHELIEIKADLSSETRTLFEVKADKMPISIYAKMRSFTNNEIQLQKGDSLYIFSDGYADQFGGAGLACQQAGGRKFKYKAFKEILLANAGKPMLEQQDILAKTFKEWKGDLKQIDDVVVLGIKI